MPYAGPGAPFATSGTGGLGSQGGGFGIPPGGLSPFTGAVSKDQLGDLDPFANNRWDDLHGQTEVDDMTIAITSLASFGAAGPIEALASRGAGAARGWLASRAATRAGMSVEEKAAAQIEARAANIEKTGDLLGTAGVPYGGEAGKIAAYFSRAEVRQLWRTYCEHARSAIAKRINPHLATLRVAAELEKAQFRHLPQGTIEEILKHPSRPPIVR